MTTNLTDSFNDSSVTYLPVTEEKVIGVIDDTSKAVSSTITNGAATANGLLANAKSLDSFGTATRLPSKVSVGQPVHNNAQDALFDIHGWNENVLSSLQQPAYKIRFFMTEDEPLNLSKSATYDAFVNSINSRLQTTIAATGVTALSIVSLTMTTTASPNKATRSMAATNMTMVVKEAMGTSMMDVLAQSAAELRIRNFSKAFYFIELSFHGYNSDGTFNHNPFNSSDGGFTNKGVWLYQVGIQDILTEMDDTGGKYTIKFIPYQEKMYEENDLRLPEAITVTGGRVDILLNDFATALNKSIVDSYGFQARSYKFKFYDVKVRDKTPLGPKDFLVTASDEKFSHKGAYSMNPVDGKNGTIKAHFGRNMTINDVVELVFANSSAATKLGMDVTTTDELDGSIKSDKRNSVRECIIYRVEVTADIAQGDDGYDYSNENYVMEYTLHVMPYYTQSPILTHQDVVVSNDPKVQADNALNLRKNNYLSKRYDYLFTGLNTEVLHLDVKFNLMWQAALPRILGTGTSTESVAQGDKQNTDAIDEQRTQQAALKEANEVLRKRREQKQALSDLDSDLAKRKAANKTGAEYDELLKKRAAANKEILDPDAIALEQAAEEKKNIVTKKIQDNRRLVQKSRIDQRGTRNDTRDINRFGEEVLADPTPLNNKLPISFVQSAADTRFITSGAIADNYDNDRSVYGAVLNQMYGLMSSGLQKISMDIKGDPYWLGAGNMERSFNLDKMPDFSIVRTHSPNEYDINRPDYTKGDILFLVTFKYPKGYDGSTGSPVFKSNDFFTGVYMTRLITHKFENGVYKQTLEANRMPLIDVYKAFGYHDVEEEAANAKATKESELAVAAKASDYRPTRGGQ